MRPWNRDPDHRHGAPMWECLCDECVALERDAYDDESRYDWLASVRNERMARWPEAFQAHTIEKEDV